MKQGIKRGFFILNLWLVLANAGCAKKEEPREVQDYNSVRAELRAQVEQGTLTREEAIVRLAEAKADTKSDARKKKKERLSPELEAYGEELKEKFTRGDMTEEEAKAAWVKAALEAGEITKEEAEAKGKSTTQSTKDSTKGEK
jgi:hypothetical protein